MITFNEQLSQSDAQWVMERAFPIFSHRIAHPTLSILMEAHNKVFKEQVGIPGCGCEYKSTHAVWTSRLSQYRQRIEDVAFPPVSTGISEEDIIVEGITEVQTLPNEIRVKTTRGRKKKNV
jgi:hypothetical protein